MTFDIPGNRILRIDRADLVLDPAPHPYEVLHRSAIEENWLRERAVKPALFNGEVMFFSAIRWAKRALDGRCHVIRFATFLHWRRTNSTGKQHLYAQAMPVSRDGALIAIRMAEHTANAGRVYFAAGSFDPHDVRDGRLDIAANMTREVAEETGLDLRAGRPEDSYHGWSGEGGTVLVRRYFLDETADEIEARIAAYVEAEVDSEISGAVVIRNAYDVPPGLMPHMRPLIAWHFGEEAG